MSDPGAPATLLLVDDHAIVRAGLKALLAFEPRYRVAWEGATAADAVRLFREHRPAVVLLDIGLPDGDGVDCCRQMLQHDPEAHVIMITANLHERDVRRAVEAGARGYLGKAITAPELTGAIAAVLAGEKVFRHVQLHTTPDRFGEDILSPREFEVLKAVRRGLSNRDIGAALSITERTARAHVEAILRKLGAADRAEAVAIGFERGLLRLDR